MQVCQNPNCSNPFNPDGNRFCISCGSSNFGNVLRNRFRVQIVIGEGGFGKTYLAEDIDRLDAACVIKQFFPQVQGTAARTKAAELFKEEAKRLFELGENHSQIPRLLAYFEQGSSLYLVQEFIEGETLLTQLKHQAFSETQIREVLADLLPVLQFVHEHNVIHRDIKPENIIRRKSDNKLVLIDFGGAKQVTQTSLARQGTGIFTIGYAPSEQMAGYATPASDLYALGATCVRLLTRCLPAQDAYGNLHDPLYDVVNAKWLWREILNEQGVKISENLEAILDKLLKHFVKERYQSAAEVLRDLNATTSSVDPTIFAIPQPIEPQVPSSNLKLQTFDFEVVKVDMGGREISRNRSQAQFFAENLGKGVILEMVQIPGGTFMMGSTHGEGKNSEKPQHRVSVKPFFMGKYPITQEQWKAVMENNPSRFKGAKRPVESVSWNDAVTFCKRLSQKTGKTYRLPTEAEWEYACRAGTTTPFHFGETITTELANFYGNPKGNYCNETTLVGSFPANAFGLYDMHGNVWEWCQDYWHDNYQNAPADGSAWLTQSFFRRIFADFNLLRGGSWYCEANNSRSATRLNKVPNSCFISVGFRVVAVIA
ncbi:bifunctional serine/threonine-protein kinase/formylglycine-generating enzyme family protein [Chlorogloeopsis sp. ULAP01]|uniref:bifunctional serine/threonine-protein kinase/formylglycine-generating enzyme family protein n=1 Tax=Chlorogloeopsis sp. ULAP01 TaxID=3056483 RepID=UPI0025AB4EA3|nr:bifunctional serine/threonine-protein kinase/formylglycine-generating enzyme family protein [Chlorogloeopsis sp. ULAP01]MDM9382623.1 bifunctional serine/threonine-protein kinase/formylglycine-generating enzyme family protein [Chlorogloeopsis sp. ULAP01]